MMREKQNASSHSGAAHSEALKRDYLESTLSLIESFARQAIRYAEDGDEQSALQARTNCEVFFRQALEMIPKLQDEQTAAAFIKRLESVGGDTKATRSVA